MVRSSTNLNMGVIEEGARKVRVRGRIQTAVLITLFTTGAMLIGANPVPSILRELKKQNKYRFKHQWNEALHRLVQNGYVAFEIRDGRKYARLSKAGEKLMMYEKEKIALKLGSKKRWDRRWRVVIFDIPEYRRVVRNRLRRFMNDCGFALLQKSVWVLPYDCENLVTLLKADLKLGNAVLYMVVEQIENDQRLKNVFQLNV